MFALRRPGKNLQPDLEFRILPQNRMPISLRVCLPGKGRHSECGKRPTTLSTMILLFHRSSQNSSSFSAQSGGGHCSDGFVRGPHNHFRNPRWLIVIKHRRFAYRDVGRRKRFVYPVFSVCTVYLGRQILNLKTWVRFTVALPNLQLCILSA